MIHVGDITKLNGATLEPVNCITGGSPCQDLSIAGKREGLAGERSGLFLEMVRVIKEMRQEDKKRGKTGINVRPRFVIWENVPGAFTSNGGEDFRCVLEQFSRVADETVIIPRPENRKWQPAGCIVGNHWSIAWRTFDAQYWGVPQRRKRIALVADFGGLSAPEILFERKGMSRDSEQSGAQGEETADDSEGRIGTSSAISFQERAGKPGGGKGILIQNERTGALSTLNNQSVLQIGCDVYNQEITGEVAASLTAASGGTNTSGPKVFCLQGNGIDRANTARCNGKGWREDQCYTLNTIDRPAVYDCRGNGDGKTVCTITGDHQNRVTDYTALCVGNGQANQSVSDKAGALNTMHDPQAVLVPDIAHALNGKANCDFRADSETYPVQNSVVRRLTPLECERLQGYPDNWTDIGEWVDSKGKTRKPADAPRYKALGNSIALPQWQWIIDRMAAYLPEDATLGSLFDGIGGFPLCWERTHGKGTARWASEIEEFPMAVTKKHFPEEGCIP